MMADMGIDVTTDVGADSVAGSGLAPDGHLPDFLSQDVDTVGRGLLGCRLIRTMGDGRQVVVRIVETEAYDQLDPASHSYHGKSQRNRVMFGPAGHVYVYFTYGMHYCLNVTAGREGFGAGVLIRAVEPIEGMAIIEERRGMSGPACVNGPAKLCKALDIDMAMYGHDLSQPPLRLERHALLPGERVAATVRIGITRAMERKRRYIIAGNRYLSRIRV